MASGKWSGDAASSRRSTLPADWCKIRNQVLKRDQRVCMIKGPMCIHDATEVDHVGSRDDHRLEALRSACRPCHAFRSAQQGAGASAVSRRRMVALRQRPKERHPGEVG